MDNEGSTMLEEELIEYLDPFSREFVLSIQAFRRLRDLSSNLEQDPQSTDVPIALNDILGSKDAQSLVIRFNAVVRQNLNAILSDIIQQAANLDHGFWPLGGHTTYRGMRNMFVPPDGPYVTRIWAKKIEQYLSSSDNIFKKHDVDDIALPLFDKSDLVAALREVAVDYDIRCNKQDPIHTYFLNNIGQRYIGSQELRTGLMLSSFVRKESLAGEVSRKDITPECQIDPRIHECQTSCVQTQFRLASRFPEDAGITEHKSAPRGTACLATLRGILRARIALQFDRPPDSWKERILYALACLGKTHREHLDNYPSIFLIYELLADGETRQMPCKSKFMVENILVSMCSGTGYGSHLADMPNLALLGHNVSSMIAHYDVTSATASTGSSHTDYNKSQPRSESEQTTCSLRKHSQHGNDSLSLGLKEQIPPHLASIVESIAADLHSWATLRASRFPMLAEDVQSLLDNNQVTSRMVEFCIKSFLSHPPLTSASFISSATFNDLLDTHGMLPNSTGDFASAFQVGYENARSLHPGNPYKTVFVKSSDPHPECQMLGICFLHVTSESDGVAPAKKSLSCIYTVVAATSSTVQTVLSYVANCKQDFEHQIQDIVQNVFRGCEQVKYNPLQIRHLHCEMIQSNNPGTVHLHTVLQILRQNLLPIATFAGYTLGYLGYVTSCILPYHEFREDELRLVAACYVKKSLNIRKSSYLKNTGKNQGQQVVRRSDNELTNLLDPASPESIQPVIDVDERWQQLCDEEIDRSVSQVVGLSIQTDTDLAHLS